MRNLITEEGGYQLHRGWLEVMPDYRERCCTGNCNQGRACPVRQACDVPEPEEAPRSLLASRALWIGGGASVALWLGVALSLAWWMS